MCLNLLKNKKLFKIEKRDILWATMQRMLQTPYVWGGDDFEGYDCSGGIQELLASVGHDPPKDQTAHMLMEFFSHPDLGKYVSSIEFGDLLFFGDLKATHVAMAVNDVIMFEFGGGGSKTVDAEKASQHNAYARFRRIRSRNDFLNAIRFLEVKT